MVKQLDDKHKETTLSVFLSVRWRRPVSATGPDAYLDHKGFTHDRFATHADSLKLLQSS